MRAVYKNVNLDPKLIEDVAVGNVLPPGGGATQARMAALHAGIPNTSAVNTVNRQCSAGAPLPSSRTLSPQWHAVPFAVRFRLAPNTVHSATGTAPGVARGASAASSTPSSSSSSWTAPRPARNIPILKSSGASLMVAGEK